MKIKLALMVLAVTVLSWAFYDHDHPYEYDHPRLSAPVKPDSQAQNLWQVLSKTLCFDECDNLSLGHLLIENKLSLTLTLTLASMRTATDIVREITRKERLSKPPKRIISFKLNSTEFTRSRANMGYLHRLTDWLISDLNNNVLLVGHTDNDMEKANNLILGIIRAAEIRNELVKLGAPRESIRIESQGNLFPIASNNTDFGKRQNRRVEILPNVP